MSDDDQPPAWLPDALKRYWAEGELRPPRTVPLELGDVPAGTEVRVRAPTANITVAAASVGRGSRLRLVGDTRAQVVVEGFGVIHMVDTLPQVLVLSGSANIHLLSGGEMRLAAAGSAKGVTARVWFDDTSESPGNCTLTTAVPLLGIRGESSAAVDLRSHGNAEGCPAPPGTVMKLPNCRSLAVQADLERCEVEIAGRLTVNGALLGVCDLAAGAVLVGSDAGARRWSPGEQVLAAAGTTVRASKGQIAVAGRVQGTEDAPVILTGANEHEVRLGAAEHVVVQAAEGQRLGEVTIGPSSRIRVRDAKSIGDHGADAEQHVEPDLEAATRITLSGMVHGGRLEANAVRVHDVMGPARLSGDTVALVASAYEDSGAVSVVAAEWVKAAASADLHVTARGPEPCHLLVGGQAANPAHQNQPPQDPPEDLLAEGVDELSGDADQTARLDLHGPLQVECAAATTIVAAAEQVVSLRTGGKLRMPAGGGIGQVRSKATVQVGGGGAGEVVLATSDIKSPSIARAGDTGDVVIRASGRIQANNVDVDELSCAKLHVDGDIALGALEVSESTHVRGRLSEPERAARAGEYRLSGTVELSDVAVPLVLDKARGTIKASDGDATDAAEAPSPPAIAELKWEKPTGSLHLDHDVALLQVLDADKQAVLEIPSPARCQRLEVKGTLRVESQGATGAKASDSDTEPGVEDLPRIVLSHGADLTLAMRHSLRIELQEGAEATARVDDSRAALHLAEEATSGRLALSLPGRGFDDQHTVRLQSHITGSEIPDQPTIVVEQGHLLLAGVFADVLALGPTSGQGPPDAMPTTVHVPAESVVHQLRGVVALGEFHGRVTGAEADHGLLHRFTAQDGSRIGTSWRQKVPGRLLAQPSTQDRLVLVDPARTSDGTDATISTGVLVGVDVTRLSFAELDRLEGLDVFSPDPIALERKARSRPDRAAVRQSNAQHLSRVAQLVEGRSVTGSVRSMANWSASTAHAATGRKLERGGRLIARWLGYGQRPAPAFVLLVVLVTAMTAVLTGTGLEARVCENVFGDTDGATEVAGYGWIQQLERVLLAPLAFLRVAGQDNGLASLGCNPLAQVVGTVLIALPLAFVLIGLRNYLRSPVDR